MQLKKQPIINYFFILTVSGLLICLPSSAMAWTKTILLDNNSPWTGFYVGGGAGLGAWTATSKVTINSIALTATQTQGGKGGYVTLTGGYDYLFKHSIIGGVFVDGDLGHLSGTNAFSGLVSNLSETGNFALGARIGKLISPTILPYLAGGYSRAYFDNMNYNLAIAGGGFSGLSSPSFTTSGWFLGAGLEVNLFCNWFLKGEYRYANYNSKSVAINGTVAGIPLTANTQLPFHPTVQTFQAVVTYKF